MERSNAGGEGLGGWICNVEGEDGSELALLEGGEMRLGNIGEWGEGGQDEGGGVGGGRGFGVEEGGEDGGVVC